MLWDIFCRVIDNHGDIGVCWRLSRDLVKRGHQVRLWVDDASALTWMAPEGLSAWPAVTLRAWQEAEDAARIQDLAAGDIVIEAFGCELPAPFVARMVRPSPPVWINLEYLSAEVYVERCHGLRSPVCSGPGAGLNKWFFYPGFTEATGGLMREPDLLDRQHAFTPEAQRQWLASLGVYPRPDDALVSVFCYADAPLGALLDRWRTTPLRAGATTHVLLTPGHASALGHRWHEANPGTATPHLALHHLPALPQPEFDHLLWSCDLNLVRGEDSAVRALWAGRPHAWHIYPQDDGVHADKLEAFMQHWMHDWPPDLREQVSIWWRAWNGMSPQADMDRQGHRTSLPDLPDLSRWRHHGRLSREKALLQRDLCSQLTDFALQFVIQPE